MKKEEVIWIIIAKVIAHHSYLDVAPEDIEFEDKLLDYFPVDLQEEVEHARYNEHANRFGSVLSDTVKNIKSNLDFELVIDFEPREEWDLFHTVEDYWLYVVAKLHNLEF